jgi:hypothetical protein
MGVLAASDAGPAAGTAGWEVTAAIGLGGGSDGGGGGAAMGGVGAATPVAPTVWTPKRLK